MSKVEPQIEKARRGRVIAVVPDMVWGPLAVGLIGLAAGQPWLFPSLGPTAYLLA